MNDKYITANHTSYDPGKETRVEQKYVRVLTPIERLQIPGNLRADSLVRIIEQLEKDQ